MSIVVNPPTRDGTYIPEMSSGGVEWNYVTRAGNYTISHSNVKFDLHIEWAATTFTTGDVLVTLPFLPDFKNVTEYSFIIGSMAGIDYTNPAFKQLTCHSAEGQYLHFSGIRQNGTQLQITDTNFNNTGGIINVSGSYKKS